MQVRHKGKGPGFYYHDRLGVAPDKQGFQNLINAHDKRLCFPASLNSARYRG